MAESSFIDPNRVKKLNDKVYERGSVDREHLLEFLENIKTNDGKTIIAEVKAWLTILHNDPKYDKVHFPQGDIDSVISDLDSYGHVSTQTILEFKQEHSKVVPAS
jgi:hypothetical protein